MRAWGGGGGWSLVGDKQTRLGASDPIDIWLERLAVMILANKTRRNTHRYYVNTNVASS